MQIYKIATKKEAKFLDLFNSTNKYEEFAFQFVKGYLEQKGETPTVGEVVSKMLNAPLNTENVDHDFLKTIAFSAISSANNMTQLEKD